MCCDCEHVQSWLQKKQISANFKFMISVVFIFCRLCPQLSVPQVCQCLHLCMSIFHLLSTVITQYLTKLSNAANFYTIWSLHNFLNYNFCMINWQIFVRTYYNYLLCKATCKEWNQVFGVDLDEAFQVRFDKINLILFLSHFREMFRVYSVTLHSTTITCLLFIVRRQWQFIINTFIHNNRWVHSAVFSWKLLCVVAVTTLAVLVKCKCKNV